MLIAKNKHLEERVKVLESCDSNEKHWYSGQPAQRMYMKQAKSQQAKAINFQENKNNKVTYPSRSKYAGLPEHKVCWSCGMSGHYKYECKKRWAQHAHDRYPEHQRKNQRQVPRYPEPWGDETVLPWTDQGCYDVQNNNHGSEPYYGYEQYHENEYYPAYYSHPGKVKLAWVRKH